jgi:hypothetical protein
MQATAAATRQDRTRLQIVAVVVAVHQTQTAAVTAVQAA